MATPNPAQQSAIETTDGPLLIIAGPGSGKTYTLVERIVHLIRDHGVAPESLFIVSFTDKAAQELVTRVTRRLSEEGLLINLDEMYLGTFHAICLRLLDEHRDHTRLKRSYTLFDSFDQQYFLYQHLGDYHDLPGIEEVIKTSVSKWHQSKSLLDWLNKLTEEALEPDVLLASGDSAIETLGRCLQRYRQHLEEHNALDFSTIQYEALRLLQDHPDVLDAIRSQIRYLAAFTRLLGNFEYLHHASVLNPEFLDQNIKTLFNQFLRFLKDGGIDDSTYAPPGSVAFLTIHQSKGLEFPAVIAGSLWHLPRKQYTDLDETLQSYLSRPPFEPMEKTKLFDFRRLYYTAYSRAQNLLVLSCPERRQGSARTVPRSTLGTTTMRCRRGVTPDSNRLNTRWRPSRTQTSSGPMHSRRI